MLKNGEAVNPLEVDLPSGEPIEQRPKRVLSN